MRYNRFEEVPVWQDAIKLATEIYQLRKNDFLAKKWDLCSQIEAAALSISNNIVEGFERGTLPDTLTFLYIARGSAGEVRSMLCFIESLIDAQEKSESVKRKKEPLKLEVVKLRKESESISRQLYKWAEFLKSSGIKGQKKFSGKTDQPPPRNA